MATITLINSHTLTTDAAVAKKVTTALRKHVRSIDAFLHRCDEERDLAKDITSMARAYDVQQGKAAALKRGTLASILHNASDAIAEALDTARRNVRDPSVRGYGKHLSNAKWAKVLQDLQDAASTFAEHNQALKDADSESAAEDVA